MKDIAPALTRVSTRVSSLPPLAKATVLPLVIISMLAAVLVVSPYASADSNPATDGLDMRCGESQQVTPDAVTDSGVQGTVQGETITFFNETTVDAGTIYQDVLIRPDGTTYYATYLEMVVLDAGLTLVPNVAFTVNGVAETLVAGPPISPGSYHLETTTNTDGKTVFRVIFPGEESNSEDGFGIPSVVLTEPTTFRLSYDAVVPQSTAIGTLFDGAECFTTVSTGPSNRDTDRPVSAIVVLEPKLQVEKTTNPDNVYTPGLPVEFTVYAKAEQIDQVNSRSYAAAQDVELVDAIPDHLRPIDLDGNDVADGGTTAGGGVFDASANTITYAVGTLNPGETFSAIERFRLSEVAPVAETVTNSVCGAMSTVGTAYVDYDVRTTDICDTAEIVVGSHPPTVTKQALRFPDDATAADLTNPGADLTEYGINLPFYYEVVVDLPANSRYENFTIIDTLPDGVEFLSYIATECTPAGATCINPVDTLTAVTYPDGSATGIGWYPNSVPQDLAARQFKFRYKVQLKSDYASGAPLVFSDLFTNNIDVNWNTVDRLGAVPPNPVAPPDFDGQVDAEDTVAYHRPVLNIEKSVTTNDGVSTDTQANWNYDDGDIATYTLEITNTGDRDANNAQLIDTPTGMATNETSVGFATSAGGPYTPCGNASTPTCSFSGGVLTVDGFEVAANGGKFYIQYQSEPSATGDLPNTANIPTYEDPFGTPYTENPSDDVTLSIPDPVLTLAKANADNLTDFANSQGTRIPFTLTVKNTGVTTAFNPVVTDTLTGGTPEAFCNIDLSDPSKPGGLEPGPLGSDIATATAPGVYSLGASIAPGASVTIKVWVEVCAVVDAGEYINNASLSWQDRTDGVDSSGNPYNAVSNAPVTLVDPSFYVSKSPAVGSGASISWTGDRDDPADGIQQDEVGRAAWEIVITNDSTVPIGGLRIVDPMPEPYEYLPGTATITWVGQVADTFTDESASAPNGVWTTDSPTDVAGPGDPYKTEAIFEIGQLQPGARVRIEVPFVHNGLAPADAVLTRINTVRVTNPNIAFDATRHEAQGEFTLIPIEPGPTLQKRVRQTTVTDDGIEEETGAAGDMFDFVIDVTIPTRETTVLHDVWVMDVLPDGLELVFEPAVGTTGNADGWSVTKLSGNVDADELGLYMGQTTTTQPGETRLGFFFDDIPIDATETDLVYRITFRARVKANFIDGAEVIDGFNEPLINKAAPVFNRDVSFAGGGGDDFEAATLPAPDPGLFERTYEYDNASIDIVTPRLEVKKQAVNDTGQVVKEVNAGDTINYEVAVTNNGSGPAFHIDMFDTLGTPSAVLNNNFIDVSTLVINSIEIDGVDASASVSCNVVLAFGNDPNFTGPSSSTTQRLFCEFDGPLAPTSTLTVKYSAKTKPHDEFFAQASTSNWDPMLIRNVANTPEYYDSADQANARQYSTGTAGHRIFAFTPLPELDVGCFNSDAFVSAPVGASVSFVASFGNGDQSDMPVNSDGDRTLTPYPTQDLDGDGYPDAAMGYNPVVRITLPDKMTFEGVRAKGPGIGSTDYVAFPPDQILTGAASDKGDGYYTLLWFKELGGVTGSLSDIPHSPNHDFESDFLKWYDMLIDVTKTETGGSTIYWDMTFTDQDGNPSRGTSVGEPFVYRDRDGSGCPGGPSVEASKVPDEKDNVSLKPGEKSYFTIYIQNPNSAEIPSTWTDLMPNGLIYAGTLAPTDPNYEVAYIENHPTTGAWAGTVLNDFLTSVTTNASGETTIVWDVPDVPHAMANDPEAGGTDTRLRLIVPFVTADIPPLPNEFVKNTFTWNADGSIRTDTGSVITESAGKPSIEKRAVKPSGLYGEDFEFVVKVTIPAGFAANDVFIYDEINRATNTADIATQADATSWQVNSYRFPTELWNQHLSAPRPGPVSTPPYSLNHANYLYTPAEMKLSEYTSASCIQGCSTHPIDVIPVTPRVLHMSPDQPGYLSSNPVNYNNNGALAWYLGDIEAVDTSGGQERIIEIRYKVEAPTVTEQRQRVVDTYPSYFGPGEDAGNPGLGLSDPRFDDPNDYFFQSLSHVRFPNLVQLRGTANQNNNWSAWDGASATDWQSEVQGGSGPTRNHPTSQPNWSLVGTSLYAQDSEAVSVSYPIIEMDKTCSAIDDDHSAGEFSLPQFKGVGVANVKCTIELTNRSPVEAFNITITDTPKTQCVAALQEYLGNAFYRSAMAWSVNNWTHDYDSIPAGADSLYDCPAELKTTNPSSGTAGSSFPMDWSLNIGANATETLEYTLYIDGWTNQPYQATPMASGSWDPFGVWVNEAVMEPWTDSAGETIGSRQVVNEQAQFHVPVVRAAKFPAPREYNPCTDAHPFHQYNEMPERAYSTVWPYIYSPDNVIAGYANSVYSTHPNYAGMQDPYAGNYWMNGKNACEDPLMPPAREVYTWSYQYYLRGLALGFFPYSFNSGWQSFGTNIDPDAGTRGWWHRPLDDPSNWAPTYYASPTEPYRWAINLRVDNISQLQSIKIEDTLPVGWEYVPGSATILDGVWTLGLQPSALGGDFDVDRGISATYAEVPLSDPTTIVGDASTGSCHNDINYHSGGQQLTWQFDYDANNAPWLYQYVDNSTMSGYGDYYNRTYSGGTVKEAFDHDYEVTGWTEKASWVRIHFDAIPTSRVFDCDPDKTSSLPFMMENNLNVTIEEKRPNSFYPAHLKGNRYDALVPVANPVEFEKTPDDGVVGDDQIAPFTIRITNHLSVPIENLDVTDTLQTNFAPALASGYACGSATAVSSSTPATTTEDGTHAHLHLNGGKTDENIPDTATPLAGFSETTCSGDVGSALGSSSTNITWNIASIAPGETVWITMPIVVEKDETNSLRWDNTAATTIKEFQNTTFEDTGRLTVINPSPAIAAEKSVTPNPATINDVVTYTVKVPVQARQIFIDLLYEDLLPDGLTFKEFIGVSCEPVAGGACPSGYSPADIVTLPIGNNADGSTTIQWFLGDVPASKGAYHWVMRYRAVVDDTYNVGTQVLDGNVLTNTVTGYARKEDKQTTTPTGLFDPASFYADAEPGYGQGPSVTADLNIAEPKLDLAKAVVSDTTPVDGNSTLTYTITVTNSSTATAYKVKVSDRPNDALHNIVTIDPTFPGAYVTEGWTAIAPDLSWFINKIEPGETVELKYTAEVIDDFLATGRWNAINDAKIDEFWGRPGETPQANDRSYTGPEVQITTPLAAPAVDIKKTVDGCADEDFAWAEVNEPTPWCLIITNTGNATAYNTKIVDKLPYGWEYDPNSTTMVGAATSEPSITLDAGLQILNWNVGEIPPGGNVQITYEAIPSASSPANVTNWAYVEVTLENGVPLPPSIVQVRDRDPANATISRFGIEISKTPDEMEWPYLPAAAKGQFDWNINITNPVPPTPEPGTTITNITVIDYLPAPLEYVSWSSADPRVTFVSAGAPGSGPGGSTPVTWTISELAPTENVEIVLTAANTGTEVARQWYYNDVQATADQISDPVVNQAKVLFYESARIGNFVWHDTDNDGVQDASETGVNGVVVTLLDANGDPMYRDSVTGKVLNKAEYDALSPADQLNVAKIQTVTANDPVTGEPGWYNFYVPGGTYIVGFDPSPTGLLPGRANEGGDDAVDSDLNPFILQSPPVTVADGQENLTIDAGLVEPEVFNQNQGAIDVEKFTNGMQADDATGPAIPQGDAVTWTYSVANTGQAALTNVKVTDDHVGAANCDIDGDGTWDGTNVIPVLLPNTTRWCYAQDISGSATAPLGQYKNTVSVEAGVQTPDFDTCGCDPHDPSTWPSDPSQYVPANDANGTPLANVNDEDPSHFYAANPAVDVEKTTNTFQADADEGPALEVGDPVVWTYVIENTGNTALLGVTVVDDQGVTISCPTGLPIPVLNPGDSVACTGTGTATEGQYANNVTTTATPALPDAATCGCDPADPATWPDTATSFNVASHPTFDANGDMIVDADGNPVMQDLADVSDSDPSHYHAYISDVDIEKATQGLDADLPAGPAITPGDRVTWTYVVTNNGTTALLDATVSDDQGVTVICDVDGNGSFTDAVDSATIPLLLPNASVTCQGTGIATAGAYTNTGSISGFPVAPKNNVNGVNGVDINDPSTWGVLDPSDFQVISTIEVDANGDPIIDRTTGQPTLVKADPETDSDPSNYFGAEPGIDIEKDTDGVQADLGSGRAYTPGDPVTWNFVITNSGNTALSNVTVSDPQVTAIKCDLDGDGTFESNHEIGVMLPGAEINCQAQGVAATGGFENQASVTGDPVLPGPIPGVDFSDPTTWPTNPALLTPAVEVQLDADGNPVLDADGNPVTNPLGPETDSDPSHHFGAKPALDVEKTTNDVQSDTAPGRSITPGDDVVWDYEITNTGNTPLKDVTVVDDQGVTVRCDANKNGTIEATETTAVVPLLLPGESVLCQGSGTATSGQYENNANVSGDVVLPDETTCGCDVTDPSTWPQNPDHYTPALTVEKDADGNPVIDPTTGEPAGSEMEDPTDTDPSHYYGAEPSVDIEKLTNNVQSDISPGRGLTPGDDITWTYVVTNTGNTALLDVTVVDDQGVAVACALAGGAPSLANNPIPLMLPGDSLTCQGSGTAEQGQYVNNGSVTGTPVLPDETTCGCDLADPTTWPAYDPSDPTVTGLYSPITDSSGVALTDVEDKDPSHYFGVTGGIDVEKTTNSIQSDEPAGEALKPGDPVTWIYTVVNDGTTAKANITVTDNKVTLSCDLNRDGVFEATEGNVIPLLLPYHPDRPSLNVMLCQATGVVQEGQYNNSVLASGQPVAPDPSSGNHSSGFDPSDPSTWSTDPNDYVVLTDAAGNDLDPSTDVDQSHYFGASPSVDVEKTTNGFQADDPNGPAIGEGEAVTWTYVVTNTGNTALSNALVTDDQGVAVVCDVDGNGSFTDAVDSNTIPLLKPDASVTCQGTGTAISGQYENNASVSATPVVPSKDCLCDPQNPALWPDDPALYDTATQAVRDADGNMTDDKGNTIAVDGTVTSPAGDVLGIAGADGIIYNNGSPVLDANGDPLTIGNPVTQDMEDVNDADPSHYFGTNSGIDVEKATNGVDADAEPGPVIGIGEEVTWDFVVTNTGNTALRDVTVSDDDTAVTVVCDLNGDGTFDETTNVIPLLKPAEEINCRGTGVAAGGAYENTATATGTPVIPNGDTEGTTWQGPNGEVTVDLADPSTWPPTPGSYSPPQNPVVDANGDPVIDPATGEPQTEDAADVEATDPSHYFGDNPGIDVEKATNGQDSDISPGRGIDVGEAVTWTYVIKNTGNTALTNVSISDDQGVDVQCDFDNDGNFDNGNTTNLLPPGATVTCQGTGTAISGQYRNQADVSATPVLPNPTACGCDLSDPTSWPDPNDPATWPPTLPDGTAVTKDNVHELFDQPNKADGTPVDAVQDDDPSNYFGTTGGIDVEKLTNGVQSDVNPGEALTPGEPTTWSYIVTNTSTTALLNTTVSDNQGVAVDCGDGTNVIALILPGSSHTCTATGVAEAGQYQNIADATGQPVAPNPGIAGVDPADTSTWPQNPDDYQPVVDDVTGLVVPPLTDVDPSHYFGATPSASIEKATNGVDADEPSGPALAPGQAVTWTYVIENTGNTAMAPATVTDDKVASSDIKCDIDADGVFEAGNVLPLLLPNAKVTCQATGRAGVGQYANTGKVTGPAVLPVADCGCDPFDPQTWPQDPTKYSPASTVDRDADGNPILDADGNPQTTPLDDVEAQDKSHYVAITGGVDIEKATNGEDADTGTGPYLTFRDEVVWTYVITNNSNVPVINSTVSDDAGETVDCGDGTNVIGLLLPGESVTCVASSTVQPAQYRNVGSVSSTPASPDPATCGCDPQDPASWPSGDPSVYVALRDPEGNPVEPWTDSDPSHYFGVVPAIEESDPSEPIQTKVENSEPQAPEPSPLADLAKVFGQLAFTGVESRTMAMFALAAIGSGSALMGLARRRREDDEDDAEGQDS